MTICSCKLTVLLLTGSLFLMAGCASNPQTGEARPRIMWAVEDQANKEAASIGWTAEKGITGIGQALWAGPKIAVLPINNLTGAPAPGSELEDRITDEMDEKGVSVLNKGVLNAFMTRHRLRYTGGLDTSTALALKNETGVEAVLISALELYDESDPPRISMHSRLVSTESYPVILWADSMCRAGDESPGFLDLGVIHDPQELAADVISRLARSMIPHIAGRSAEKNDLDSRKGIQPRDVFRSPEWVPSDTPTVAVVPFLNLSTRPEAGEILQLHFADLISKSSQLRVIEPGLVRSELLKRRVTMQGGLSKPHLELLLNYIDADLVLTGTVFKYEDGWKSQEPGVEFSVQLFERESKRIVWSSRSVGNGEDGVFFFNVGRRYTACALAAELSRADLNEIISKTGNENN